MTSPRAQFRRHRYATLPSDRPAKDWRRTFGRSSNAKWYYLLEVSRASVITMKFMNHLNPSFSSLLRWNISP
jgi:hypothetical protein